MTLLKSKVITKEEYEGLPKDEKPIFHQDKDNPEKYVYSGEIIHNSMVNAKQERDKYKSEAETAKAKASLYEKFGDPAEIDKLFQRKAMIEDQTKSMEEQISRANQEAREREAGRVKAAMDERDSFKNGLLQFAKSNVIDGLLANSGIDPAYEEEARLALERRLKTDFENGRPVTYVMSEKNPNELARDPESGDPMSPSKFFAMYRQSKSKFFAGDTTGSGAGFTQSRGSGASSLDDKDPATWSWPERKEWTARNPGPDAFRKHQERWDQRRAREVAAQKEALAAARR